MGATPRPTYEFGGFRFDPAEARLERDGVPVKVTPKALDLLAAMVSRPGHLWTKQDLLEQVWPGTFVEGANLSVHVSALRRALGDENGEEFIETVPRRGYRFVAEVRSVSAPPPGTAAGPPTPTAPAAALPEVPRPAASSLRPQLVMVAGLVASLAGGMTWWAFTERRPGPGPVGVRSVLVATLDPVANTNEQEHLGPGMAHALTVRLAGVDRLRVSPASLIRAEEHPLDAARRLNVDAVLTGSIQRDGDRLRVFASLVDSADRSQIWAGRFDERFTDIFEVQDSIAERIATSLVEDLSPEDRSGLRRREAASAEAYDLYLKGRERWARRTAESIRSAVVFYQEALRIDPSFALAYAGLADAYTISASGLPGRTRFPLARDAAERALALNPELAEAQTALGFLSYKSEWDWVAAERHFVRAIAIDADYALAHHWFGEMLGLIGRTDESAAAFERARALDPESAVIRADYARMLARAGRPERAIAIVDEGLAIDPSEFRLHRERALALAVLKRDAEAVHHLLRARELAGAPASETARLAEAGRGGLKAYRAAEKALLEDVVRATAQPPVGTLTALAIATAAVGDREGALAWLERCAEEREDGVLGLRVTPEYDFMRDDPRFIGLMRRVRYP